MSGGWDSPAERPAQQPRPLRHLRAAGTVAATRVCGRGGFGGGFGGGQTAGDAPPAPLPVAVQRLGVQPDQARQPPGLDDDLVAIERPTVARWADAEVMVPAADPRPALPRLDRARLRVDPLG